MTVADALVHERAAFRAVVRWRALYSRMRPRIKVMGRSSGERLHWRLKDAEYAAILEHQAAERQLAMSIAGLAVGHA